MPVASSVTSVGNLFETEAASSINAVEQPVLRVWVMYSKRWQNKRPWNVVREHHPSKGIKFKFI
jgi:hypothetical protein